MVTAGHVRKASQYHTGQTIRFCTPQWLGTKRNKYIVVASSAQYLSVGLCSFQEGDKKA